MAKHVGDTTGVVIAPSDVAGSTALHRLEFLICVCGSQTQVAYSRDGLTMAWYARVYVPLNSLIGYSVSTGVVVNRVRIIYVLPAGVVRCQS